MFDRDYQLSMAERLGSLPATFDRTPAKSIWFHAVSVGEVISAAPLLRRLREARPKTPIYISTSTVAGWRAAKRQLSALSDGIFYAPIDFGRCVRSVLKTIRPTLLIVFETEIWPNLYNETKQSGIGLVLVNARISDRTWPKYKSLRWFFGPILNLPDLIFPQTEIDKQRYIALGVPENRMPLIGNLKYDAAISSLPHRTNDNFGAEHVWIAASTVGPNERGSLHKHSVDEDDVVIDCFRRLSAKFSRLLLVLAPRQPARFDVVAGKLKAAGVSFVTRSSGEAHLLLPGVLLLDTIGELAGWFSAATLAFVGGSIAPRGGHNILEPAAAGIPVITGPHMHNFEAITRDMRECGALIQISKASEFAPTVEALLRDPERARLMGEAGREMLRAKAGTTAQITPYLLDCFDHSLPKRLHSSLTRPLYRFLARRWTRGAARRRSRAETERAAKAPLPVPVISIGGISVGGSGKTPLANQIATWLRTQGWQPAILTRGYHRKSTAEYILLGRGATLPAAYTGDEPRIFLRAGQANVGIGSKRYQTAKLVLERFPETNVMILDDGFQHARMPRDIDILVVDGMDPWGGGEAVPLGRLREPLELLSRASIIVVNRAENDRSYDLIREGLRKYAADVPVYRSRTTPLCWRDPMTNERIYDVPSAGTAAFCGLGNPENFWRTLDSFGIEPAFRWEFPDHHAYRPLEIQGLVRSAKAHRIQWLLTTEKDCNNLPERTPSVVDGVRFAWLDIELVIDDSDRFYQDLRERIEIAKLQRQ